jgi:hypothetical protein
MTKQDEIQKEAVNKCLHFYKKHQKGYLNVTMRVGKSKMTIDFLKEYFNMSAHRILISYPDNKQKKNWESECEKWKYINPNIRYVNFSSLSKFVDEKIDCFIIDEFHSCSENEQDFAEKCLHIGIMQTA